MNPTLRFFGTKNVSIRRRACTTAPSLDLTLSSENRFSRALCLQLYVVLLESLFNFYQHF